MITLFWNFGMSTSPLLALHYGDKIHKMRASFKTFVSKKATIWQLKESQSNDKLLFKMMSSATAWNKKHSSKKVASIAFFAAATFEGL